MTVCSVFYIVDTEGHRVRCDGRAEFVVLIGCVHEHIREATYCFEHMAKAKDERYHDTVCALCLDGQDPHNCEVHLVRVKETSNADAIA